MDDHAADSFKHIFLTEIFYFDWNFTEICSCESNFSQLKKLVLILIMSLYMYLFY